MKNVILKIYLSVIVLMLSVQANGQSGIVYDTCFTIRQYEGEWRNVNGQDTIKVYFRVLKSYSQLNNFVGSELLGWHEYKVGNNTIQSDYSHRFDVLPTNFAQQSDIIFSIGLAYSECSHTINNLYGGMRDISKNRKPQNWKTTRLSANTIEVHQIQGEEVYGVPFITGFTLPETFILTKQ